LKKLDPTEQALDRLSALKNEADAQVVAKELKSFLKNRSNFVVAKAAKIASEARLSDLVPEMLAAFQRLMKNPSKLDKGCAATTEITAALYEMDYVEPDIYLAGIHHVQMEGSYGPPVDVAAKLRGLSAQGLARTRYPHALDEIVSLLVDDWPQARVGAVRALAANGGQAGALVLKLKVLTGESEPDVLAECFSGLLAAAPESSLPLVARYIDSRDLNVAEVAIFALGSSRLPQAFDLLKEKLERMSGGRLRKALLLAIAMIRSEAAIELLLGLLPESTPQTAREIITALATFRSNESVRERVEAIVSRRNDRSLSETFREQF
jgi:hypothetical protein